MQGNTSLNRWFAIPNPKPDAALRIFCLPYAGGNVSSFLPYASIEGLDVELCAVQLPGKGSRLREAPYENMSALVNDLATALIPLMDKPFIIWGHSLGSRIGYELIKLLKSKGMRLPVHFILAASRAPHEFNSERPMHGLSDEEFKGRLKEMGGTPDEVIEHDGLMSMLLPGLKADFKLAETHKVSEIIPLNIPATLFGGTKDTTIPSHTLPRWENHLTAGFELVMIEGDHFFIDKQFDSVSKKLVDIVQPITEQLLADA
ncbi:putative Thioesterase type II [Vibrio nigripulchritudo SFn27]|uniref:Putative Thioesterase type II n=1 Tax=Vibrio nigripulchritudo TaxID=28173 RepID=U4JWA1_9VIBR|nr:thioesterase domain-containing protein [Vibrio nigripulchritudo]CCN83767.1 putative Thioesterase type II [Vibrio nigripulchritudo BLFn1]CCN87225.1 putative Thioesterase type II [Vibrio nigripulchritudo SFn27]CCN94583.1 putative Thioesterase type II [Vibrio nigripulchritudo ENn2]CCO40853.1 putative Thioesterase type II [Vibrio nigripulchritudo SFn135]CCO54932.1 putative Thioesterase type II [Vibrio nigripulchritudo Wn13]